MGLSEEIHEELVEEVKEEKTKEKINYIAILKIPKIKLENYGRNFY